jgi:hypothetical protein
MQRPPVFEWLLGRGAGVLILHTPLHHPCNSPGSLGLWGEGKGRQRTVTTGVTEKAVITTQKQHTPDKYFNNSPNNK